MRQIRSIVFTILCLVSFTSDIYAVSGFENFPYDSLDQKIQLLKHRIESYPDSALLHCKLGYLLLEKEDWGKADRVFKNCIKLTDTLAQAYNGLGLARHEKGLGAIIPVEAVKKLLKIDNYSKAEKNFKTALKIDPDYLDPRYNLGKNYLAKGGNGNYRKAVNQFKMVLDKDLKFKDSDFMLGVSYQHLRDFSQAETIFKQLLESNRFISKAMFKLSDVYLETGREEEATRFYYDGIVKLKDKDMFDDLYAELKILMTTEEQATVEGLPLNNKGEFFRKFWKKKDPTPTTLLNERYVEHFQRVKHCMENFPDIIPPYYDDRGMIFVKYGPP